MPIYEYICESCGEHLEVLQKMSDPAPAKCEKCNAGPLVKKMSLTSFQLKGGGWYADGYSSASGAKKSESSSSSSTTNTSSSTESKSSSDSKTPSKAAGDNN